MPRYKLIVSEDLGSQLEEHLAFIKRVSFPAARRFLREYISTTKDIAENPYMFPVADDPVLPEGVYRRALFGKWYKIYYYIEDTTVYIDAVVDGRRNG